MLEQLCFAVKSRRRPQPPKDPSARHFPPRASRWRSSSAPPRRASPVRTSVEQVHRLVVELAEEVALHAAAAFSYASRPVNEASPLLPVATPSASFCRMRSGDVVPPAVGLRPDVELRLAVVGDADGHQRVEVHLPWRNAASSSGATVPSRIIFVTCRSLVPARDAIWAAVMPLARSRA